ARAQDGKKQSERKAMLLAVDVGAVAWFAAGGVAGGAAVGVTVLLLALVLVPEPHVVGENAATGMGVQGRTSNGAPGQERFPLGPGDELGRPRQVTWELRKGHVLFVVERVSRPLVGGLKFALFATTLGFSIAIAVTRINFWVARKVVHLVGSGIGRMPSVGAKTKRILVFLRFADEVVGYAQVVMLFALRFAKVLVRLLLKIMLEVLQKYHILSPVGLLSLLGSVVTGVVFEEVTWDALQVVAAMALQQLEPVAKAAQLDKLKAAMAGLYDADQAHQARDAIHNAATTTTLGELPDVGDVKRFVGFAVGTYGQMGLKFLGILPYGSVTSDLQAAAYCSRLETTRSIIAASWKGSLYCPGYTCTVDAKHRCVVVAVRGSIMPHDFVTDLHCTSTDVKLLDVNGAVHEGMLRSAKALDAKLRPLVEDVMRQDRFADFELILTGHSLGAGVASLLGAQWATDGIKLRVFGYGTPALVSPDLAAALKPFVRTIVMGNDMVPRFSLRSFQRLRARVLQHHDGAADTPPEDRHLCVPGVVYWMDDTEASSSHLADLPVRCCSAEPFEDLVLSSSMFSSHLPQNYAFLSA
ncbi:Diacylglycerol lipase-alpha (DAGL-alpha) (DGL-alpha) (Neural stem cell-derived dendrite regulator) (Sn1-specific diacylglycerol lipase alpha), partial [Durusdinium trenchii]